MTQDDRINRMDMQLIDMRLAVSALVETVTQHQRNFETVQRNFETVITEIRDIRLDMQEMQSEVRGLQTENRRILDILQNRHNNGDS
jgi:septation ring formation regulator EzrA